MSSDLTFLDFLMYSLLGTTVLIGIALLIMLSVLIWQMFTGRW